MRKNNLFKSIGISLFYFVLSFIIIGTTSYSVLENKVMIVLLFPVHLANVFSFGSGQSARITLIVVEFVIITGLIYILLSLYSFLFRKENRV